MGWSGVLVEPQPALAQKLREQRSAKVFACACSSPANAGKMLQLHVAGIHSSLNPDFFVAGMRREDVIEVPARTLDDILEEANAPTPIDLLVHRRRKPRDRGVERRDADALATAADPDRGFGAEPAASIGL